MRHMMLGRPWIDAGLDKEGRCLPIGAGLALYWGPFRRLRDRSKNDGRSGIGELADGLADSSGWSRIGRELAPDWPNSQSFAQFLSPLGIGLTLCFGFTGLRDHPPGRLVVCPHSSLVPRLCAQLSSD